MLQITKVFREITCPDDIALLPWKGNHAQDRYLFDACEAYIKSISDRELQKQALMIMEDFGMGSNRDTVSDKELDDFLETLE